MPTVSQAGIFEINSASNAGSAYRPEGNANRTAMPSGARSISPENADSSRTVAFWLARNSPSAHAGRTSCRATSHSGNRTCSSERTRHALPSSMRPARNKMHSYARTQFKRASQPAGSASAEAAPESTASSSTVPNPPSIKRIARRQVPCDAHNASPCASKAKKSATLLSERAAMRRESP